MEIWKDVPGYEGKYQASTEGRVRSVDRMMENRSVTGKVLKGTLAVGYYRVCLGKKNHKHVHRIIAETFIPNSQSKPEVNHINGVKTDNRVSNLEWVTKSENKIHDIRVLGHKPFDLAKHMQGKPRYNSKK